MITWAIRFLRVVLLALFAAMAVLATLSFPGQFRYERQTSPASLASWAFLFVAEIVVLSVMVIIFGAWKLLTLISRGSIFTTAALHWLTVMMIPAAVITTALGIGVITVAIVADDPGPTMLFMVFTLIAATLTLIAFLARAVIGEGINLTREGS